MPKMPKLSLNVCFAFMSILIYILGPDIDGFLVGGACIILPFTMANLKALKPEFIDIVNCKGN